MTNKTKKQMNKAQMKKAKGGITRGVKATLRRKMMSQAGNEKKQASDLEAAPPAADQELDEESLEQVIGGGVGLGYGSTKIVSGPVNIPSSPETFWFDKNSPPCSVDKAAEARGVEGLIGEHNGRAGG